MLLNAPAGSAAAPATRRPLGETPYAAHTGDRIPGAGYLSPVEFERAWSAAQPPVALSNYIPQLLQDRPLHP